MIAQQMVLLKLYKNYPDIVEFILSDVYRIHQDGIWTKENQFHRNLLAAQADYDYFRYFNKYAEYFVYVSLFYVQECFEELKKSG